MTSDFDPYHQAALQVLALDANQSKSEQRAAVMQRLQRTGFLLEQIDREALSVLGFEAKTTELHFLRDKAQEILFARVEEFGKKYWTLDPPERQAQWQHLNNISIDFPLVRNYVNSLKGGLDYNPPKAISPDLESAVQTILDIYPMSPRDRIREAAKFRDLWGIESEKLEDRVERIQREYPALCAFSSNCIRLLGGTIPETHNQKSKSKLRQWIGDNLNMFILLVVFMLGIFVLFIAWLTSE
ncbi:MAG: hypothetical protein R3B84_22335 [Zavarzinella sp.]